MSLLKLPRQGFLSASFRGRSLLTVRGAGLFAGGGHKSFLKDFAGVTIFWRNIFGGHKISGGAFSVPGTPNAARGLADGHLKDLVCFI